MSSIWGGGAGISGLTATRIPYASSATALADSPLVRASATQISPATDSNVNLGTNALRFNEVSASQYSIYDGAFGNPQAALAGSALSFGTGGGAAVDVTLSRSAANTLSLATGDILSLPAGSAALPSLAWAGATNAGFFQSSGGAIDFSSSGTARVRFEATGVGILSGGLSITAGSTATSGTVQSLLCSGTYSDGGTDSTTVAEPLAITPTVNYTGGTKTGKVVSLYIGGTATSMPTGQNAALSLSSVASTSFRGFMMHNTSDEDTNYERFSIYWGTGGSANNCFLRTENAGTGTLRTLFISGASIGFQTNATTRWNLNSSGHFVPNTDNASDIGATATRIRNSFQIGYWENYEISAPGVAPANGARIYVVDNGSGKTQLAVIFQSGAAQILATEP